MSEIDQRYIEAIEKQAVAQADQSRAAASFAETQKKEVEKQSLDAWRRERSHAWLSVYCAALNCVGIKHDDAVRCADKAINEYQSRFFNGSV